MSTVLFDLALAYTAATLLPSAGGHLAGMRRFAALVRGHGVLPAWLASAAALVVPAVEATLGLAALWALAGRLTTPTAAIVLGCSAGLGLLFLIYLHRLLHGQHARGGAIETSCGCSPFGDGGRTIDGRTIDGRTIDGRTIDGRTTSAAYAPAGGLVVFAGLALLALVLAAASPHVVEPASAVARMFPVLWGLTLAVLASLIPATVPPRSRENHSLEVAS